MASDLQESKDYNMSMGTAVRIEDISTMMSFFPGDSMYVFVNGEQLSTESTGPLMLDVNTCAYLMTLFARQWFANVDDAKAYLDANFDQHWYEKEQGIIKDKPADLIAKINDIMDEHGIGKKDNDDA